MKIGKKDFEKSGYELNCLSDYSTLLNVAQKEKYISEKEFELLSEWSKDSQNWNVHI